MEISLMCEGRRCRPLPIIDSGYDEAYINILQVTKDESVTKHGWEYRYIDGRSILLCPRC